MKVVQSKNVLRKVGESMEMNMEKTLSLEAGEMSVTNRIQYNDSKDGREDRHVKTLGRVRERKGSTDSLRMRAAE